MYKPKASRAESGPTEAEIEELRVLAQSDEACIFTKDFPQIFRTKNSRSKAGHIKSGIMDIADRYSGEGYDAQTKKMGRCWKKGKKAHIAELEASRRQRTSDL